MLGKPDPEGHAKALVHSVGVDSARTLASLYADGLPPAAYWSQVLTAIGRMSQLSNEAIRASLDIESYNAVSSMLRRILSEAERLSGAAQPPLPRWRRFTRHWLAGVCSRSDAARAAQEAQAEWERLRGLRAAAAAEGAAWSAYAAVDALHGDTRASGEKLRRVQELIDAAPEQWGPKSQITSARLDDPRGVPGVGRNLAPR